MIMYRVILKWDWSPYLWLILEKLYPHNTKKIRRCACSKNWLRWSIMRKFVFKKIFNKFYDMGIKFGNGVHSLCLRDTYNGGATLTTVGSTAHSKIYNIPFYIVICNQNGLIVINDYIVLCNYMYFDLGLNLFWTRHWIQYHILWMYL